MARLPQPGGDAGNWGDILNDYLRQAHDSSGLLEASSVGAVQLESNSVTAGKLAPGSVTAAAIATHAVTAAAIAEDTIAKTKLATAVQASLDLADTALQIAPVTSIASKTGDVSLVKADVGLGSADDTSDANKPVSTAQQTALDGKRDVATGNNRVYTRDGSGVETTIGYGSTASQMTIMYRTTGGVVSVGTPTTDSHATTKLYVDTADALKAPLDSPAFTGTPTGITKTHVGLGNIDNTSDATKNSATSTLTNKRVTPRVGTVVSGATITPTSDSSDMYTVTALAANATIAAPTGTPTDGQKLLLRIIDNGTARTLTWNAIYKPNGSVLPASTVASKTLYVLSIYNASLTKWDVVSVAQEV